MLLINIKAQSSNEFVANALLKLFFGAKFKPATLVINQALLPAMLRHFHIENFKSLTDFTLDDLGQFTCLIGLNGSGKTAVLQAIDFMAHLASGTVDSWLKERDWKRSDLTSKLLVKKHLINFRLEFQWADGMVTWEGAYNASLGRCTREEMRVGDKTEFSLIDGQISFEGSDQKPTVLDL